MKKKLKIKQDDAGFGGEKEEKEKKNCGRIDNVFLF